MLAECLCAACSSSLVACGLGYESIRSGRCTAAAIAGCNLLLDPSMSLLYWQTRMLSADCRQVIYIYIIIILSAVAGKLLQTV